MSYTKISILSIIEAAKQAAANESPNPYRPTVDSISPTISIFDQIDRLSDVMNCIHGIALIYDQILQLIGNPEDPRDCEDFEGLQMAYSLSFGYLEKCIDETLTDLEMLNAQHSKI